MKGPLIRSKDNRSGQLLRPLMTGGNSETLGKMKTEEIK